MRFESKITVAVRKRPLNRRELEKKDTDIIDASHPSIILVKEIRLKLDLTKYVDEHKFIFDAVFSEEHANEHIYDSILKPLVLSAFEGTKVNCIAFGQTGSGKTYTMMGTIDNSVPGMYYLAARDIFSLVASPGFHDVSVTCGFFEIYCGKAHDLLNNRENCPIRVDAQDNVNIVGLCEAAITNVDGLMKTIQFGLSMRITGQTGANDDSSRSHAILHINLKQHGKLLGRMSFIDLAGSERGADVVDTDKQTRFDGAEINKSLLALKECIRALDMDKRHLPFRGSKLTLVLKDSFVGNCKTVLVGNISPAQTACEHTLNTLRYADRVKELKKTSGSCERMPVSKEDMLAKALMLPRLQKDSHQQKLIEEKDQDLVIVKPFEEVIKGKQNGDSTAKEKKSNYKDKFTSSRPMDPRKSQGSATLTSIISASNSGNFNKDKIGHALNTAHSSTSEIKEKVFHKIGSQQGPLNQTQPINHHSTNSYSHHDSGSFAGENHEVRQIRVTRIMLNGDSTTTTTHVSGASSDAYRGGYERATSPDMLRAVAAEQQRNLSQSKSMLSDKTSFLKRPQNVIDGPAKAVPRVSANPINFADRYNEGEPEDPDQDSEQLSSHSNKPVGRSTQPAQKATKTHTSTVTSKVTSKASTVSKSKSFLQASEFIQSLKDGKDKAKKTQFDKTDPLSSKVSIQTAHTPSTTAVTKSHTAKASAGPKKGGEDKRENSTAQTDAFRDDSITDFQDAYEQHIAELKTILSKDEAILAEMRRQKNLTSTGLALFMDAWKNLLNQKIRQVNNWKEKIKHVETAASGKGGKIMNIGGSRREDCIVEESLFDGEES